jgi:hypothetical protein
MDARPHFSKEKLAERWGVSKRTLDAKVASGLISPPDLFLGTRPFWSAGLVESDEEAAAAVAAERREVNINRGHRAMAARQARAEKKKAAGTNSYEEAPTA